MIVVLIRSFNRPQYLEDTLSSIEDSQQGSPPPDAQYVIYDDGSTDARTRRALDACARGGTFRVVRRARNAGCRQSYLDALAYLRAAWGGASHFAIMDNDVDVAPGWLGTLRRCYAAAEKKWPGELILLSGFNPTNSHQGTQYDIQEDIHQRATVGAVCYFFSAACIPDVERGWRANEDWGVNDLFHSEPNHRMCGTNQSVVNHVGVQGLHSRPDECDHDAEFEARHRRLPPGSWSASCQPGARVLPGGRLRARLRRLNGSYADIEQAVVPGRAYGNADGRLVEE